MGTKIGARIWGIGCSCPNHLGFGRRSSLVENFCDVQSAEGNDRNNEFRGSSLREEIRSIPPVGNLTNGVDKFPTGRMERISRNYYVCFGNGAERIERRKSSLRDYFVSRNNENRLLRTALKIARS
jgi:hypothetical protein